MDLEDRLEAIPHLTLDLSGTEDSPLDAHCHRPEFSIWASWEVEHGGSVVTLAMKPMWGQQIRYADMMPTEARRLASLLLSMADAIAEETAETMVEGIK